MPLRRLAALALTATLVLAGTAAALDAGPDIFDFEAYPPNDGGIDAARMYPGSGVTFQGGGSQDGCQRASARGGWDGGVYVRVQCFPILSLTDFAPASMRIDTSGAPRATAQLFVRATGSSTARVAPFLRVTARSGDQVIAEVALTPPPTAWTPVVLRDPAGVASIQSISVDSSYQEIGVDDVGLSRTPQPDTEIVSGPGSPTSQSSASFTFRANQSPATFRCSLDGAAAAPCPATFTLSGLAPGTHTVSVAAVDRWNTSDPTPATHTWTITSPPPGTAGTPSTGGPVGSSLPSGDLPPLAGVRVRVRLLAGEVFVRLPTAASAAAAARQSGQAQPRVAPLFAIAASAPAPLAEPAPIPGFVPLKGVASLPVGSTVDARVGRLSVQAAANALPPGAAGRRLQAAIFSAGLFRLRQARRAPARAKTKTLPLQTVLASAPDATRVCAVTPPAIPPKKTVRTLRVSTKGIFQAVGGAARATGRNAEWTISDRCDGTVTKVQRGRVTVTRPGRAGRGVSVRAKRSYLVRARLFSIRKGRGN